jgi:murein DD-endopeptidase MepM/ murein hydrolase activator NlpD
MLSGILLLILVFLFVRSAPLTLSFQPEPTGIGIDTPLTLLADSPHGIRSATATIEQNGQTFTQQFVSNPGNRLFFWRQAAQTAPLRLATRVGRKQFAALKAGRATLILSATANDLRGSTVELRKELPVVLEPPSIAAASASIWIARGGSAAASWQVKGEAQETGVAVASYRFRGRKLPDGSWTAAFGFPPELDAAAKPAIYARSPDGQEVMAPLAIRIEERKMRERDISLPPAFLQKTTSELAPSTQGDLLTRYLAINTTMRKENDAVLRNLRSQSSPQLLHREVFRRFPGSSIEALFGDHRSYTHEGKTVDQQWHQGIDVASTKEASIPATGAGKILFAQLLGIYGNCVVIDHGAGIQTVYAHLSAIKVKVGDNVAAGQSLGNSGVTGLAYGDHLHYGLMLDGTFVDPVQWWDKSFVEKQIVARLAGIN